MGWTLASVDCVAGEGAHVFVHAPGAHGARSAHGCWWGKHGGGGVRWAVLGRVGGTVELGGRLWVAVRVVVTMVAVVARTVVLSDRLLTVARRRGRVDVVLAVAQLADVEERIACVLDQGFGEVCGQVAAFGQ